jgi:hypothetical protein
MVHQAADRFFDWNLALAMSDLGTGLSIYNALLLQDGGLAPDYVLRNGFPVWLWRTVLILGAALLVRRIVLAVASRSWVPPATFAHWSTLAAGLALGLWCFHVLVSFDVPVFAQISWIFGLSMISDRLIAGLLMVWFWPTELRSVPWLREAVTRLAAPRR